MVRASLGAAQHSSSYAGSYAPSTRSHGLPGRQNVSCSVLVPVMDNAAVFAGPLPDGKGEIVLKRSAERTHLAAWEEAVYLDHGLPMHRCFRFESSDGRSDGCVRQAAGKAVVFSHAAQVQVFDVDHIVAADEVPDQLVDGVSSAVSDLLVDFRQLSTTAFPAVASLLFTSKFPLLIFQPRFIFPKESWVGNSLPVRERSEARNPEVNADGRACLGKWRGRNLHHHRDKVTPRRLADQGDRRWFDRNVPRPLNLQRSKLRENQTLVTDFKLESAPRVLGRLPMRLLLEGWVTRSLLKEVAKGGLQVAKRLLQWNAGHIVEPGILRVLLQLRQCRTGLDVVHPIATLKRRRPFRQKTVIDEPAAAEGSGKLPRLFGRWVIAERPADFHAYILAHSRVKLKRKEGRWYSSPYLKAGVSALP